MTAGKITEDGQWIDIAIGNWDYEGLEPESYDPTEAREIIARITAAIEAVEARQAACAIGHDWDASSNFGLGHMRCCARRGCTTIENTKEPA